MTPKERYLAALQDPSSGITVDTPAHLIEGTFQNSIDKALIANEELCRTLTFQQKLDRLRQNSSQKRTFKAQPITIKTPVKPSEI